MTIHSRMHADTRAGFVIESQSVKVWLYLGDPVKVGAAADEAPLFERIIAGT